MLGKPLSIDRPSTPTCNMTSCSPRATLDASAEDSFSIISAAFWCVKISGATGMYCLPPAAGVIGVNTWISARSLIIILDSLSSRADCNIVTSRSNSIDRHIVTRSKRPSPGKAERLLRVTSKPGKCSMMGIGDRIVVNIPGGGEGTERSPRNVGDYQSRETFPGCCKGNSGDYSNH